MDIEKILSGLVRVGTVTAVDHAAHVARVKFQGENMTSGWLFVVQHYATGLFVNPDGEHTHTVADTYTGGGSASKERNHDHTPGSYSTYWMPKVNETVLVLYLPVFNADGFILGGIG